jgi:anti-sigma-K factor RskA
VNVKEYISSGILESYVMGELNPHDQAEVERNIANYPELKEELEAIEQAQEFLLMKTAINPPAAVKPAIFNSIESRPVGSVVPIGREHVRPWQFAAAASIAIALIASYMAYDYRGRWKAREADLLAVSEQNRRIAEDYTEVNDRLNRLQGEVDVIASPEFTTVVMRGTENSPQAMASVYWNPSTQEVYLKIQNMKQLSRENQYQLWAIIDGKPVDAGVFDAAQGLLKMKNISKGAVLFAVTVEPRGGKPSPTLQTMQVKGEVGKG